MPEVCSWLAALISPMMSVTRRTLAGACERHGSVLRGRPVRAREWATFDPVSRGEPIGVREDGSVVHADRDAFIVFPNSEALPGTEWFYFAVASERDLTRTSC